MKVGTHVSGQRRWTDQKAHGGGWYSVYDLPCIRLMYFWGYVM